MLYSCGDLSRTKAKNMILNKLENGDKIGKTKYINFINHHGLLSVFGNSALDPYADILLKKGYITTTEYKTEFELTPKGKPYISYDFWARLEIATLKDINILGIKGDSNHKSVEFDIIYTLNSLGEDISYSGSLTTNTTLFFSKYDDGWRIDK